MTSIKAAAAAACLDETVESFAKGYDTFVGERGVTLSGGQKQRAAIARTLTGNTPIMIFDDSLSAVDTETDAKIRARLEERFGTASIILISHRITTLAKADKILVLENGRIVEQGGKMLPFLKKYRRMMVLMVLFGIGGSVIDIGTPLLQRYALNHFVGQGTLDTLLPFILLYVFVILFTAVTNYFSALYSLWLEVRLGKDLRNAAFEHIQTLSFSYFNQNSVGYIHARVMSDTSRIGALFSWTIIDSVWQGAYVIGAIVAMLVVNARLALLVLLILPLLVVLFSIFQKKLVRINREIREINSKITGNFNEGITGAKTVKTLVIEDKIEKDFRAETGNMLRRSVYASHLRGMFAVTMNFASSLALAIVLWRGGYIARSEIGTFSMFMSYAQGMMEPIRCWKPSRT